MLRINTTRKTGPTIALCVIAKNEADMIADCIESVRGAVDEIVVVDTGSTDRTVEIAKEHGARVEHFEWIHDFAAARNFAIDAATSDWILMLDADERLTPESRPLLAEAITKLPPGFFGYCVQIENTVAGRSLAHYMTRLFPKHPGLRFVGSIHEELKPLEDGLPNTVFQLHPVRILHLGYEPEIYAARNKDERNMTMLLRELEQTPDDARLLYYIIQQHCARVRHELALPYIERFMANKSQMRLAFDVEVSRMWLEALWTLGRFEEAAVVLKDAEKRHVVSSYSYEMLGNYNVVLDHKAAALDMFVKAQQPDLPAGLWGRPTGDDWKLITKAADCRWDLGQYRRALTEVEHALPMVPEDLRRQLALTVIQRSLNAQQFAAAYRWIAIAHELSGEDVDLHLEVADIAFGIPAQTSRTGVFGKFDRAVASQNWQAVYEEAVRMPMQGPPALARVLRITSTFLDEGAADAALDVLSRALDAYPGETRIYWTLIRALNALGRHAEAADALAVLESLQSAPALAQAA